MDETADQAEQQQQPDGQQLAVREAPARYLANGTPVAANGRFLGPPAQSPITKENAHDLVNKRWRMYRQAEIAARGGMSRISATGRYLDAWADITEAQARTAASGKGRESVEAARFVGKAAGLLADGREQPGGGPGGDSITVNVPVDVVRRFLERLAAGRRQDGDE